MDEHFSKHLDLLRHYHDMQLDLLKHYEESRTKISQIILALSSALIGISKLFTINGGSGPVGPLVVILGFAGIVFSWKYTTLANRRTHMARSFRREIAAAFDACEFADIDTSYRRFAEEADKKQSGINKLVAHIQVRWCWIGLHGFVTFIGLTMTF